MVLKDGMGLFASLGPGHHNVWSVVLQILLRDDGPTCRQYS